MLYTPNNPYLAWIESFGLNGPDTAPDADPDQDGVANGIGFVLGTAPNDASSSSSPELSVVEVGGNDYLRFSFTRTDDSVYLAPTSEISSDLVGWTPLDTLPGYLSNEIPTGEAEVIVEQLIPFDPTAFSKRFVRLKVEIEPPFIEPPL